jgi:UDPglucose--hexose-1-phosphate uridylyltransferase
VFSLADLTGGELTDVVTAWSARAQAAKQAGFPYLHLLVNEGREAGGTLFHTHSQLLWLRDEPPALEDERSRFRDSCTVCALLADEQARGSRIVLARDGAVVLAPSAGRAPYELLVAPLQCESAAFESPSLTASVHLVAESIRRLRTVAEEAPLNVWLHTFPDGQGHWHIELLPRLSVFAGLELGAGLYVNSVPPEAAAERLRSAAPGRGAGQGDTAR